MVRPVRKPDTRSDEKRRREVLTKATMQAASELGVKQAQLAQTVGVSAATASRMGQGAYVLDPVRKEWELATLFVRVFRSLDTLVGGHPDKARIWLNSDNDALNARPIDLLPRYDGLIQVLHYLDACRGRI